MPANLSGASVALTAAAQPTRRDVLGAVLAVAFAASCRSSRDNPGAGTSGGAATAKKADDAIGPLLAPADLAARIADVKAGKIAVLYVGPDALFGRGHVPGARKVGEAGDDDGRSALATELLRIPKETEIVLYCGCCPVRSCPNVRPASAALRASGRTIAHVLNLPTRFADDWTAKGYPVERS
jgi:3-mercaptopyruvate sulfurtransferase SseA